MARVEWSVGRVGGHGTETWAGFVPGNLRLCLRIFLKIPYNILHLINEYIFYGLNAWVPPKIHMLKP